MTQYHGFKVIAEPVVKVRGREHFVKYIIGRNRKTGEWEQLSHVSPTPEADFDESNPDVVAFLRDVAPSDQHMVTV